MNTQHNANAKCLQKELDWFYQCFTLRTKITFERTEQEDAFNLLLPPSFDNKDTAFAKFVTKHKLAIQERFLLVLALIPHVKPSLLDILNLKNTLYDIPFTEFGGVKQEKQKGFLPTGETAMFLLAGEDISKRFNYLSLFQPEQTLFAKSILRLEETDGTLPKLSGILSLNKEYLPELLTGTLFKPRFSANFPAMRITTAQDLEDLIVDENVRKGIENIQNYLEKGKRLKNEYSFGKRIKKGYRVLFSGPSGTGKTLTATLLGKACDRDVYRVDLSTIVSKYIGETEKNLARVFDLAESKDWILFFDEADALFGKRSATTDAHDRYANQGVSFLLQRIEDFDGLIILCSNFKNNIDEAFFRRFQAVIDFKLPTAQQRYIIWKNTITDEFRYEEGIDLDELARKYEFSAATIINVLHHAILIAMRRDKEKNELLYKDILRGIKNEKLKEGSAL